MDGLRTRNGKDALRSRVRYSRPRSPGVAYAGLTLALAILVGAFALTSRHSAPPTIAEFAPRAVEQISDPSGGLAESRKGALAEASTLGEQAAAAAAAQETIEVARVRRCVGDPPRQIEDPQSPLCVPYWSGDNGGATWEGVTRNEVRVAVVSRDDPSIQPLEAFFNRRFEFYGRRLRLVDGCFQSGSGDAHVRMRADAVCVDEQLNAFASADYLSDSGNSYFQELAKRGVLAASHMPNFEEAETARYRPYLWQYTSSANQIFANLGQWTCARLAGSLAVHAGDPLLAGRQRRFGIVLQSWNPDAHVTSDALEREMARCGVRAAEKVVYCFSCSVTAPQTDINAVTQLKAAGVTSVLCLCVVMSIGQLPRAATSQGWFPEWLISTYHIQDSISWVRFWGVPREQLANTFGLRFLPKAVAWERNPAAWALQEMDPSYPAPNPPTGPTFETYELMGNYRTLLLVASGIQMAGPRLTPETFERGIAGTKFPNPDHPNMAGHVGFGSPTGGSDYSMTDDAAEIWWSNDAAGGAYCYVDGGVRYSLGSWPSGGDPFFKGPCDPGGASE